MIFDFARAIISILLIFSAVLPPKKGVPLLTALAVSGSDIGSAGLTLDGQQVSSASIWQLSFGFIKPSWILFAVLGILFFRLRSTTAYPRPIKTSFLWFTSIPILTGAIYGGLTSPHAATEVPIDLKLPLILLSSLLIYLSLFRSSLSSLHQTLIIFLGGLISRHLVDLGYLCFNLGPEIIEGVSQGSLDSAKGAVIFLGYWGILLLLRHNRIFGGSLVLGTITLLVAYNTRMLWITFLLGYVILACLEPRQVRFFLAILAILMGPLGFCALALINSDTAEVAFARYLTIVEGRDRFSVDVAENMISRIDPPRYAEFLNILDTLHRNWAYLWGMGYGGFYHDTIAQFPILLGTAFPEYSLYSGQFYRAHDFVLHILLKYGIVGLLIIGAIWIVPFGACMRIYRRNNRFMSIRFGNPLLLDTIRALLAFTPTAILQLYWAGKGLFLSGIILGILYFLTHSQQAASDQKYDFSSHS